MGDKGLKAARLLDLKDDVREWVIEKHEVLKYYIAICSGVRRKFSEYAESTYIDLYSGAGKSVIKETHEVIPGSPIAAAIAARKSGYPFDRIFVADADPLRAQACAMRLSRKKFPVEYFVGKSEETVQIIANRLQLRGFHFAFLDPYNLDLPFSVIVRLAQFTHVDMLVHVSDMDLSRNLDAELANPDSTRLECFAPGWRDAIESNQSRSNMVRQFLEYWTILIQNLGLKRPPEIRPIKNTKNRQIYHLALLSQNDDLAARFWKYSVKADSNQTELF